MSWSRVLTISVLILGGLVLAERVLSVYLPKQGLFAGIAVGLVFGVTTPNTPERSEDFVRALRTAVAFGVTTGIGFALYRGADLGLSWGIGGPIGLYSSFALILLVRPLLRGSE